MSVSETVRGYCGACLTVPDDQREAQAGRAGVTPSLRAGPGERAMIRHWVEAMGDDNPSTSTTTRRRPPAGTGIVAPRRCCRPGRCGAMPPPPAVAVRDGLRELIELLDDAGFTSVVATNSRAGVPPRAGARRPRLGHATSSSRSPRRRRPALGVGHFVTTLKTYRTGGEVVGTQRWRLLRFKPGTARFRQPAATHGRCGPARRSTGTTRSGSTAARGHAWSSSAAPTCRPFAIRPGRAARMPLIRLGHRRGRPVAAPCTASWSSTTPRHRRSTTRSRRARRAGGGHPTDLKHGRVDPADVEVGMPVVLELDRRRPRLSLPRSGRPTRGALMDFTLRRRAGAVRDLAARSSRPGHVERIRRVEPPRSGFDRGCGRTGQAGLLGWRCRRTSAAAGSAGRAVR